MDYERIATRAARRLDIQKAALAATQEEIKILAGVDGLTKAVASLQVKRDRQTNAIEVTKQLLDHYTKLLAKDVVFNVGKTQGKIK